MVSFGEVYQRLNVAQKQAVDAIDGPVLVIAGPGTGKTQLLTTRIANILDKTDALPENILCLTFTDSAAATMRERLSGIIGQAAYNVTITTYHAFGSELIRRYPEYFTSSANLQPVDDLTIDSIFRDIQARLPYSNPLKYDTFLRDVKMLVSDSKRALLTPEDLRKVADDNETFIQAATTLIKEPLAGFKRMDKSAVGSFLAIAEGGAALPNTPAVAHVVPLASLWQTELLAALHAYDETGKTSELTRWKNNWLVKDESGDFIAAGHDQVAKLRAGAIIYERYLSELERLGLYDYDDMILHAIRGLEQHADLRYTLQERYQFVLLDEYQDTNEAQSRLVELLTDSPASEGRPNVMAVGDDDQAIYAFQGANYSHMLSFYERYRDVLVVPLTENYRSHGEILELSAGIAAQISQRLHHNFPKIDKTITAARQDLPPHAVIERHEFKSDLSQYAWVADKIKTLIDDGMPANEIAVLAPKHEYLETLVPFLHHAQLPVHYEKRENVLEDPAVSELVTMSHLVLALSAHDHGRADNLWSQVLSLPMWHLSAELVWRLSWQANDTHESWTDVLCSHSETKQIALFFIRLSQLAGSETLEQLMDYLIGITPVSLDGNGGDAFRSPFYEYYFGKTPGEQQETLTFWQLLSNLTVLRQHLREYRNYESEPLHLHDFIAFVEANQAANIKIINTNPYQEATAAVELMTAYKAKGREFQAVFILAAIDEVWGTKARALGSRLSLPPNLQFIRYAGTTEDERLRLLYVALTRAETNLYLTSYSGTYTGRLTTRLKYLDEHDEAGDVISPLLPDGRQKVYQDDQTPPELAELTVYWQQRHHRALEQPQLKSLLKDRLEHFQLSPTQLNCFVDVPNDGPSTFFMQNLLRFPSAPTVSGQFGSAIHETLEWIHLTAKESGKPPTPTQTFRFFERRLELKRLGEPQTELLASRGREALRAYLGQRAETIAPDNVTEYNFRGEGVFVGKAHLSGKIDKLIIDKADKTIVIVDYKTGKAYQRWAHEVKLHFYRQQLYFYKLLVEQSNTYKDYRVVDAYLEFVEPDAAGLIRELHVEFDDDTMREFEQLIASVWRHIMALDFPDVSAYSRDLKGIESFQRALLTGDI